MSQTPQDHAETDFGPAHEPNRVESRESGLQEKDLARLLRAHPELTEVQRFIKSDPRFETAKAWVHVNEQMRDTGFMTVEMGMLNGALVVADRVLLKRFDREDLGLSKDANATEALDRHIPYVAQPENPLS